MNFRFLRTISLALILALLAEPVAFAAGELRPSDLGLEQKAKLSFKIPESVASVEDAWIPASAGMTVYLLEDAHTNTSGQMNLAKTLEIILKNDSRIRGNGNAANIFVEAGSGNVSLSTLRTHGSTALRQQVAQSYLKQGLLHGEEYLDLTSNLDFTIWGVENFALYKEAIESYRAVAAEREKFGAYLSQIQTAIDVLKPRLYRPRLLAFQAKADAYHSGLLAFTDFVKLLLVQAEFLEIPTEKFTHLKRLRALGQLESKIDVKKAQHEKAYFNYLKASKRLGPEQVLKEEKALEELVFSVLAQSADEKDLRICERQLKLYKKLFQLTLSPEEYSEYRALSKNWKLTELTAFLNKKITEQHAFYERALFLEKGFDESVEQAERFYELTCARDEAFVENMLSKLYENPKRVTAVGIRLGEPRLNASESERTTAGRTRSGFSAILIAGGYHTPNLKSLLRQKGISYFVIRPQVYQETNQARYEKILLGQKFEERSVLSPMQNLSRTVSIAMEPNVIGPLTKRLGVERSGAGARLGKGYVSETLSQIRLRWKEFVDFILQRYAFDDLIGEPEEPGQSYFPNRLAQDLRHNPDAAILKEQSGENLFFYAFRVASGRFIKIRHDVGLESLDVFYPSYAADFTPIVFNVTRRKNRAAYDEITEILTARTQGARLANFDYTEKTPARNTFDRTEKTPLAEVKKGAVRASDSAPIFHRPSDNHYTFDEFLNLKLKGPQPVHITFMQGNRNKVQTVKVVYLEIKRDEISYYSKTPDEGDMGLYSKRRDRVIWIERIYPPTNPNAGGLKGGSLGARLASTTEILTHLSTMAAALGISAWTLSHVTRDFYRYVKKLWRDLPQYAKLEADLQTIRQEIMKRYESGYYLTALLYEEPGLKEKSYEHVMITHQDLHKQIDEFFDRVWQYADNEQSPRLPQSFKSDVIGTVLTVFPEYAEIGTGARLSLPEPTEKTPVPLDLQAATPVPQNPKVESSVSSEARPKGSLTFDQLYQIRDQLISLDTMLLISRRERGRTTPTIFKALYYGFETSKLDGEPTPSLKLVYFPRREKATYQTLESKRGETFDWIQVLGSIKDGTSRYIRGARLPIDPVDAKAVKDLFLGMIFSGRLNQTTKYALAIQDEFKNTNVFVPLFKDNKLTVLFSGEEVKELEIPDVQSALTLFKKDLSVTAQAEQEARANAFIIDQSGETAKQIQVAPRKRKQEGRAEIQFDVLSRLVASDEEFFEIVKVIKTYIEANRSRRFVFTGVLSETVPPNRQKSINAVESYFDKNKKSSKREDQDNYRIIGKSHRYEVVTKVLFKSASEIRNVEQLKKDVKLAPNELAVFVEVGENSIPNILTGLAMAGGLAHDFTDYFRANSQSVRRDGKIHLGNRYEDLLKAVEDSQYLKVLSVCALDKNSPRSAKDLIEFVTGQNFSVAPAYTLRSVLEVVGSRLSAFQTMQEAVGVAA